MKATVSVICYKHKVLAKDEFPLMVRIAKDGKRALSKAEILKIINADCSRENIHRRLADDLFSFSYLYGGISFVDMANLVTNSTY